MLNTSVAFFNKTSPSEELESKKLNTQKHVIYRDDLSKIKPTIKSKPIPKKGNSISLESSKPFIEKDQERKGVMRVKVMMTKQEANRLLSRCKDGGVLEFKDVARELVRIPVNRVTVLDPPTALKTIPEEF